MNRSQYRTGSSSQSRSEVNINKVRQKGIVRYLHGTKLYYNFLSFLLFLWVRNLILDISTLHCIITLQHNKRIVYLCNRKVVQHYWKQNHIACQYYGKWFQRLNLQIYGSIQAPSTDRTILVFAVAKYYEGRPEEIESHFQHRYFSWWNGHIIKKTILVVKRAYFDVS